MAAEVKDFFDKFKNDMGKMKELIPDTVAGFSTMFGKIMKDGALGLKEKELIALAISVAVQCDPCIKLHTKKCLEAKATKEQILEAACVAVVMGGGPAYTHMPIVIDTLEELES